MLSPVLMREHRNYTTPEISCQEVSRNIYIFFLCANILTVEHGRRVQVPVTPEGRVGRRRKHLRRSCSTYAHSGVVGGLSQGGIHPLPDRGCPPDRPDGADRTDLPRQDVLIRDPDLLHEDIHHRDFFSFHIEEPFRQIASRSDIESADDSPGLCDIIPTCTRLVKIVNSSQTAL